MCVVGELREERVGIWRGVARAPRHAHWSIAVGLAARLATVGVTTMIEIVRWDETRWFPRRSVLSIAIYAVIWIVMASYVVTALPAAAVERRRVVGALVRAWRLVCGERWKVLAIGPLHYALLFGISWLLFRRIVGIDAPDRDRFMRYAYVRLGIEVVMAPFAPVLAAVMFERLRASKEGPAETQLARVLG